MTAVASLKTVAQTQARVEKSSHELTVASLQRSTASHPEEKPDKLQRIYAHLHLIAIQKRVS